MLEYVNSEGILLGYLSHKEVRLDVSMCVNGLAFFNEFGRGHELVATEDWIYKVLNTRAFRDGTHYCPSPDVFLYFVSRMIVKAPQMSGRFELVLRDCVLGRMEAAGDALSVACRLIAAARCRVRSDFGLERLLSTQREDGSWDNGVIYHSTREAGLAYHQGLTVSLAVLAVEEWANLRQGQ